MASLQSVFDFFLTNLQKVVDLFLANPILLIPVGVFITSRVVRLLSHLLGGD
jgi:hypothetical protein